ncbi:prepilin-type N-terminal cleavage/methylation domain-containing protein [bacterium]|nr:prepilin-type N-terminal cleavage/methylation domain-containing protein [bacterium]
MRSTFRAFTLIELLIVVAIIAILAAIAVPNFLEAQTRSKVSRFMADLRTCATGMETYYIDANRYPPADLYPAGHDESITGANDIYALSAGAEGYTSRRLTTPISYLTSLPSDIFAHGGDGLPNAHAPHYINDQMNQVLFTVEEEQFFSARTKAALALGVDPAPALYNRTVKWHMHSHGPDKDHDDFASDAGIPVAYDPTNGTVSDGDIFYFGPGLGFTSK